MTQHDYNAVYEAMKSAGEVNPICANSTLHQTILQALKLAAIVTGECSDDMCEAASLVPVHGDIDAWNKEIFKAMRDQMLKEIDLE